jgi:predicted nucleic acid-binding OB-fold protein
MVMKEEKKVRSILLPIRLNIDEKKKLNSLYGKTTCNSLSEYARSVLLKEPVTIFYRNQTADEFLAEMIQLKKELNAIGNNFNQAVHKLHTLDHIPEIKAWAILNETGKKSFLKKVEEISNRVNQIYELWSQK